MSVIQVDDLNKGINAGYGFSLGENVRADFRDVLKPSLLTALMQTSFNNHMLHAFTYDKQTRTVGLPNVKSRTENGKQQMADPASQLLFATGSFGTGAMVQKQDWFGIRKVGGEAGATKTEADALEEMLLKIQRGWDLHTELGMATLVTGDTNLLNAEGGNDIFPSYDYSALINGTTRAPESVDLAGAADDIANRFTMAGKRKQLQQELSRLGMSASGYVCICSDEFFRARFESEAQLDLNRDLRSVIDLGTQSIPEYSVGGFIYDNFMSSDGIWYINYGSEIVAGTSLIPTKKAYLMPRVSGMFSVEFSPTMRRNPDSGIINTMEVAQPMYVFSKETDFGVSVYTESNRLYFNRYPQLIKELTLP